MIVHTLLAAALLLTAAGVSAADEPGAAAAPSAAPASPCASPEHHQFDFWIGRWDVFDARNGERAGSSLIEQLYGGCVLRENWTAPGFEGGSLNIYSAADGKWHQTWVDQAGALREFVGALDEGRMVIVATQHPPGAPERTVLVRLTYTANPDGTVRQYSDFSKDGGATWAFRYDYLYKRAH